MIDGRRRERRAGNGERLVDDEAERRPALEEERKRVSPEDAFRVVRPCQPRTEPSREHRAEDVIVGEVGMDDVE